MTLLFLERVKGGSLLPQGISDLCTLRMPTLRPILLLCAMFVSIMVLATHNRAGEIIVCHQTGPTYRITIITHTKLSAPADRPELVIDYGDGQIDTIARSSISDDPGRDLRRSEYVVLHNYPNPGVYTLSFDDQNRNSGVINVPNSISQSFCVKTQLVIGAVTGQNCSVRFLNPPIQNACINQPWIHNPAAFDANGDSLSYEPAICLGLGCEPIAGYTYPTPNYSINPTTGTITWSSPTIAGEYNIAFIVREWRRVNGVYVNVGWVTRDMQITVVPCDNRPPNVAPLQDTCVVAGSILTFNVQASDPDAGQLVSLTAQGEPFVVSSSPANFTSPPQGQSVNSNFTWITNCSHVRAQPYQVVFNARDNGQPVQLQGVGTMSIRIIAPPPLDPGATPSGNAIQLTWAQGLCTNVAGYRIYRRSGLYGFVPGYCETGVPAYTGYGLIASVQGANNTSYLDEGPLVFGNQYCYMVVGYFNDGSQSIASEEFCAILDRQVPLITHVSVGVTDISAGVDTVRWSNAYDLDTLSRPGPYQFRLYRGNGSFVANELIWTSALHPFLAHPDTSFLDVGINTLDGAHVYRVEFLGNNGEDVIGSGDPAASVFISTVPADQQLTVQWTVNTPWVNSLYEVFRFDGNDWVLVGTSTTDSYVDAGLENGVEYCYYVRSTGAYSDPEVVAPLINYSQETCDSPRDITPPCIPTLVLDNDCELPLNTLVWTNPAVECDDLDTDSYNVWFADSLNAEFRFLATLNGAASTLFTHVNGTSVAGCYSVSAVDSLGNESARSNVVCGDNCPDYRLPNVLTPNGDGANDSFGPFLPFRGVNTIDLQIFNRWGQVVFETNDPAIDWKGTYKDTTEPLSDGVYFYICNVVFSRLAGEETMVLKGHVQILGSGVQPRSN
jgi:gliding motility-associated-like protein